VALQYIISQTFGVSSCESVKGSIVAVHLLAFLLYCSSKYL